jgi:hypothetical protein
MDLLTLLIAKDNAGNCAMINNKEDTIFSISNFTAKEQQKKLLKPDILTLFNGYIEHHRMNDRLEALYLQMFKDLDGVPSRASVQYYMKELLMFMDVTLIKEYIVKCGMNAPTNLKREFNFDNEKNAIESRDQTYLVDEFIDLMTVVIGTKVLIPLINIIIVQYTHEAMFILLRNAFPEYLEIEPMRRLIRFIESHINKTSGGEDNRVKISTMVDNVGSTELADYVLGTLIFKTFPSYETILNPPTHSNIIGGMYYAVFNIFNGTKKSEQRYTIKGPSSTGDSDSEQSIFESFRQATPYSPGKIEVMRKQYRDVYRLAKDFEIKGLKQLDNVLKMCQPMLDSTQLLHTFTLQLLKITMTKFVNGLPYDSPESYGVLEREQVVNMVTVFTCLALENGHTSIAKYFAMLPDTTMGEGNGRITKPVRVASLSRASSEQCESEYCVYIKTSHDGRATKKINEVTDSLNSGYYTYLLEQPLRDVEENFMSQSPTIREDFANYIKFIKEF